MISALKGGANEVGEKIIDDQALRILDQEIRDSAEDLSQTKAALAASFRAIQTGQESDHDLGPLRQVEDRLQEEEHSWTLHRLYAESPALAAWILKQPKQVQRATTGHGEPALKLLGPDLYKRLGHSQ